MNIHVSECKYYCLHLVPKFDNVRDNIGGCTWLLMAVVDFNQVLQLTQREFVPRD